MKRELPSPDFLRKILRYEPDTGKLFWRHRTPDTFIPSSKRSAEHLCGNWNPQWAGREAFTALSGQGYHKGFINGRYYEAAHVAWAMVHGVWPQHTGKWVDHINRCRTDNRIKNLRLVTPTQNAWNRSKSSGGSSGGSSVIGVTWHAGGGKWQAGIKVNGRQIYLGLFSDFEDAVAARKQAEKEHHRWQDLKRTSGSRCAKP